MYTPLNNDVLDTIQDIKDVIDLKKDIQKIEHAYYSQDYMYKIATVNEIYGAYPWINWVISLSKDSLPKRSNQMTVVDYQYILDMQHRILCLYEGGKVKEFLEKEYNIKYRKDGN